MEQKITKIDITYKALFRIFIFGLLVFSLFYFSEIILWIFLALVISFLFNPLIDILEQKKISRSISAVIIYTVFLAILFLGTLNIFPPLITELVSLTNNIYGYSNEIMAFLSANGIEFTNVTNLITTFQEQIMSLIKNTFSFAGSLIGQIFAFMTIFTIALFLSIENQFPITFIKIFTIREEVEKKVLLAFESSKKQVVGYFNAKILASVFVFVFTLIFLSIISVKYALSLSIIAGIFNIIPIVGPIISCLFIVFFALFDSWVKALIVILFCIILQQIESNLLVPVLTKKIIGIPTVLVLISVLIGAKLGGIVGAIFIIPIVGIIYEFIKQYFDEKKETARKII